MNAYSRPDVKFRLKAKFPQEAREEDDHSQDYSQGSTLEEESTQTRAAQSAMYLLTGLETVVSAVHTLSNPSALALGSAPPLPEGDFKCFWNPRPIAYYCYEKSGDMDGEEYYGDMITPTPALPEDKKFEPPRPALVYSGDDGLRPLLVKADGGDMDVLSLLDPRAYQSSDHSITYDSNGNEPSAVDISLADADARTVIHMAEGESDKLLNKTARMQLPIHLDVSKLGRRTIVGDGDVGSFIGGAVPTRRAA
jgi:hypothetical protein